ncbi:sigma-70 family RNA polymerase sigma factor [Candidatus Poribacteria bacterium]|nr:sigma-70 family RNA polymerase sigma factor [Candidatus Poribacteria bacterium]
MAQITLGNLKKNPALLYQFIEENTRPMIQYCVRRFVNEEEAEDLVHNALLKLIELVKDRNIREKDISARAWMLQELKWRCIDFARQRGRVIAGEEGEKIIYFLPDDSNSMGDKVAQKEIHQFLRECIEKRMNGRRQEIFKLYLEGYIAIEIAQTLGVSRAFISKEIKIGCHNLRQWLKQRGFD